ncbi:unnamed protein product [Clonostachys rosea f. rosea IK726]|uniref:Ketoreductase (KR) domain-containing protein n=2 Tax=Bionectria ochroleuca TaxID=29856 RepID=A0A0B7KIB0_BIOOC|nr:unnamed protein product [Clonostachys rosea f. rosea IK726]
MAILAALEGTGSVMYSNLFVKLPAPSSKTNLSEQIFVITGGNGGLGYESCLHLSKLGVGKLIIAVRNKAKGEAARLKILASTKQPESSIEVWTIDMDSYDSIKAFAARVSSDLPRVDGILANAGIMTTNLAWSEGSESSLNVNVISTFLLFFLLLPKMRESGKKTGNPCRFTIPNSALHYMAPLGELQPGKGSILGRLNDEKTANMGGRYPLTKLLVLYVVREIAKRAPSSGETGHFIINTPNPSFCRSDLARENADSAGFKVFERVLARSTEEGSRALLNGVLGGTETHGHYLNNCQVQPSPACHVTDKFGQQVQTAFFEELIGKLERIQPGVSLTL